jgi:hypothetical protein
MISGFYERNGIMFQFWKKSPIICHLIGSLGFITGAWSYFDNLLQYLGLCQQLHKTAGQIDHQASEDTALTDTTKLHVE